jgi:hypothetical protein
MEFTNTNDWMILEWHTIIHGGESGPTWADEPFNIEFVPVLGWENKRGKKIPITPSVYQVTKRLDANRFDKTTEFETLGYIIRDGVVFDIDDMSPSDFWEDIYDYAFAGREINVHNNSIPDCYRQKFMEIFEISKHEKETKHA